MTAQELRKILDIVTSLDPDARVYWDAGRDGKSELIEVSAKVRKQEEPMAGFGIMVVLGYADDCRD